MFVSPWSSLTQPGGRPHMSTMQGARRLSWLVLVASLATPALAEAQVTVDSPQVAEYDGAALFTLNRPGCAARCTVNWELVPVTATAGVDYTGPTTGTVTFSPLVVACLTPAQSVSVPITNDATSEIAETFQLRVTSGCGLTAPVTGTATILNDDLEYNVSDATVVEGNTVGEEVQAIFSVYLTHPLGTGSSYGISWATSDGTAAGADVDFMTTTGFVVFSSRVSSVVQVVEITEETLDENDEVFYVDLSGNQGGIITRPRGTITIQDDDAAPSLTVTNPRPLNEGNTGTRTMTYTVQLSTISGRDVTFDWATANGTATAGTDYVAASGRATIPAGTLGTSISVTVNGDTLDEDNETVLVLLSNPVNAVIADGQGDGVIVDDDAPPTISIADTFVTEGNTGNTTATFTVSLSAVSGRAVSANWFMLDGTAIANQDYVLAEGGFTIPAGQLSTTFTVQVIGDFIDEIDETFTVDIVTNDATILDGTGECLIVDDDALPIVTIDDVAVNEGNIRSTLATFTVTLSNPSSGTVTMDWATAPGTATPDVDYTTASGRLAFAPGVTSMTVSISVTGDVLDELDETYFVNLSNVSTNATLADGQGQGTILDDDASPSLSITDVRSPEGNTGSTSAVYTVTLSAVSGRTVTVAYATTNGSATSPADFTSTSGTLTFAAGVTSQTISVPVLGDTLDELDETYTVDLSAPVGATLADAQGLGTILDDDTAPTISIADATVTEGNTGTVNLAFTVSLSAASGQTITVGYATSQGTATAPADYTTAVGTLTIPAGTTAVTLNVSVAGDLLDEVNETLFVDLSAPVNATLVDAQGQGTITDDDAPPSMTINDVTITEGSSGGTTSAVFTVTLGAASGRTVTVDWSTANGTATSPADYTTSSGALTFAAGTTSLTVAVPVVGDALDEVNETFFVNLLNGTNVTITDAQGQGTITDDDAPPTLSITDVTVTEGNAGTTSAVFTVSLSAASGQSVTVDWATAAGTALATTDYTTASGTLTFAAGTTSLTVSVSVAGDVLDEVNETFFVNLTNPVNATTADAQGQGTITDDDAPPTISIADVTVTEGNAGTVTASFLVTLSAASGQVVTVSYASANGTATSPGDYAAASGTLTFNAGITSQTVAITVNADTLDEVNETFTVTLSAPVNATLADGSGTGTITDDDAPPTLTITDVTAVEGTSGNTAMTFTVTLSAASGLTVTGDWATAAGTATANVDYTTSSGTLSFAPGVTTQTFTVNALGDTLSEANETFFVNVTNVVNATILDGQGQGTITDDDAAPSLAIGDVSVTEGNTGTVVATFTVTLTQASGQTVTVDWSTAGNTAISGTDFVAGSGSLSFAAGATSRTFTVTVNGDTLDEANETFFVNLTNAVNAPIIDAQAIGTITDD
ncbi:hypothetical protein L6R52_25100, partial [Myxococcota bacterium]|nr:hypothetical protein [Myxococcota bacterium]